MSLSMYNVLIAPTSWGKLYFDKANIDPLNCKRVRTDKNTHLSNFNCGGFALSTYNWVFPFMTNEVVNELVFNPDRFCEEEETLVAESEKLADSLFSEMVSAIEVQESITLNTALLEAYKMFYDEVYNSPIAVRYAKSCMLKTYSDLRVVYDFSELKDDEYGVIYAGGADDFHFVRYDQFTKTFQHKIGGGFIQAAQNYDDAFYPDYDSERIFFAKKR